MISAGRLRHRVTLQEKRVTRDSYGAEEINWVDVAPVWAAVEPLKGKEFFAAQQVNAEVTHRVTMRYRPGVTSEMRVKFGDRILEITSPPIDPEERHVELQLMCTETA